MTEDEVLAAYRAWIASWSRGEGDFELLTEDRYLRACFKKACREEPIHTAPRVVEISPTEGRATVYDELRYFDCDPVMHSRSPWTEAGRFVLERRDQAWIVVAFEKATTPTPLPPTRDPSASTPAPGPTEKAWTWQDALDASQRALGWINFYRQENGVPAVQYAPNLQDAANEIARHFYESNRAITGDEINAILQAYGVAGAVPGYMTNDVPLPWGTCNTAPDRDPADLFRFVRNTAWEVNAADLRAMAVGAYGPYGGSCGPSITLVVLASAIP